METSFNPQYKLALNDRFIPYLKGNDIYPFNIEISCSGKCYESCKKCFYKEQQTGVTLSKETFNNFFNYAAEVVAVTWTGGGEPTENDLLPDFTESVRSSGKKQGLFTNLSKPHNINTNDFEWVRVTCTPRNMKKEDDLKKLRACKKVGLCINYTGSNDDPFVDTCIAIGYKFDLDYIQIRPALEKAGKHSNVLLDPSKFNKHSKVIYTEYKFEEQNKYRGYEICEGFNFVPFIWEDGLVTACAYHRKPPYILGDLTKETYKEIVQRMWLTKSLPVIDSCQVCCKNHEINKMIYASKLVTDRDFI